MIGPGGLIMIFSGVQFFPSPIVGRIRPETGCGIWCSTGMLITSRRKQHIWDRTHEISRVQSGPDPTRGISRVQSGRDPTREISRVQSGRDPTHENY